MLRYYKKEEGFYIMEKRFIYADNAATTKVSDEVLNTMLPYFTEHYGNPSSIYEKGRYAQKCIEQARETVANCLGCKPNEIFFTSCGSESDNWALKSTCEKLAPKGKKHVITSVFEHHAILHTCEALEKQGFEVTYLPIDEYGYVNPQDVADAIREDTAIVSIMFANNEIGTIQPIEEIAKICKEKKVLFHTDAVQAVGHVDINVKEMGIDMLSLSGHKIHAQKGVGALYVRNGIVLPNLIHGGGQERSRRAGTENVPAIMGLAKAMEIACANIPDRMSKIAEKRNRIIDGLLTIPKSRLNGGRDRRLAGNINVSIEGVEGESLLLMLDQFGICASSGSACTSGSLDPSHVLLALGLKHEVAHGSLRISIDETLTDDDVDYILEVVPKVVKRLRDMSPVWETMVKEDPSLKY
jgi:cysteine desulfurase